MEAGASPAGPRAKAAPTGAAPLGGVFLSYRRSNAAGHTGRLFDALVTRFGRDRVFMDVEAIAVGADFQEAATEAIAGCAAVVVVIGRDWASVADARGRRRIDLSDDPVRVELETALAHGVRLIPALVEGAAMPGADELPESLAALPRRNAIELSDARWAYDVGRLIETLEALGVKASQDAARREAPAATRLPVPGTPLVGRHGELESVADMVLRKGVRLVTVTGPGGIGKTRFALEVARSLAPAFRDGAFFVELAGLRDDAMVLREVGRVFGIRQTDDAALRDGVTRFLTTRDLLLVLDNFEHVVDAAPVVAELVARAPDLKVIVTSRAALRLSAEHEFPLGPLSLPPRTHQAQSLAQSDAVIFFEQRAQAVNPRFALSEETIPAVSEICVRLDGLPLAIELAAARVKLMSPAAMLDRLQDPMRFLTGGPRDLPERQQTLRATIEWSYRLLKEPQRCLLARLGVFAAGWTLEAAEQVCGEDLSVDVLEGLQSLLDSSLVSVRESPGSEVRFALLELIRDFAAGELEVSGEADVVRLRHATYFLRLATDAEVAITAGHNPEEWLDRLDTELGNLRAAMTWAAAAKRGDILLALASALEEFWSTRGPLIEGREWLRQALLLEGSQPDVTRAKALWAAGWLAYYQGDIAAAIVSMDDSIAVYRRADEPRGLGRAAVARAVFAMEAGDYARASALAEEGADLLRRSGDAILLSRAINCAGYIALLQEDPTRAVALIQESLELARKLTDTTSIPLSLENLGFAELETGQLATSLRHLRESVQMASKLDYQRGVADALVGLAALAAEVKEYELAAAALAAIDEWCAWHQTPLGPYERRLRDRTADLVCGRTPARGLVEPHALGPDVAHRINDLAREISDRLEPLVGGGRR